MYEDYNDERRSTEEGALNEVQDSLNGEGSYSRYTSYSSVANEQSHNGSDGRERYGSYSGGSYTGNSYTNSGSTGNNNANRYTQYRFSGSSRQQSKEAKRNSHGAFWKKALTAVALGLIFGGCAGVFEMLLQSAPDGTVTLLPALPKAWPNGCVRGLRTRAGTTVDIEWSDGELIH